MDTDLSLCMSWWLMGAFRNYWHEMPGQWSWTIKSSDFSYITLGEASIWTQVPRGGPREICGLMCPRTVCNTLRFTAHPHLESLLLMVEGKLSTSQMAIINQNMACDNRSWKDCDLIHTYTCSFTGLGISVPQQPWEANMEKAEHKCKCLNNTFRNNASCFVGSFWNSVKRVEQENNVMLHYRVSSLEEVQAAGDQ